MPGKAILIIGITPMGDRLDLDHGVLFSLAVGAAKLAKGRLVLSDCLHYAKRYKPDCVVDLATLTGACVVALGAEAIGLMTKDERLAARLNQAGHATHERVWRLPLWGEECLR